MQSMSENEIKQFIDEATWGTLIAIDDGKPYAVEVSYANDGKFIYCGSMPGGRMAQCMKKNSEVAFKICKSTDDMSNFKAVIVEGQAKILTEGDEIANGLKVLYAKLGLPESRIETRVNQLTADKDKISFYRIPLQNLGGKRAGTGDI